MIRATEKQSFHQFETKGALNLVLKYTSLVKIEMKSEPKIPQRIPRRMKSQIYQSIFTSLTTTFENNSTQVTIEKILKAMTVMIELKNAFHKFETI